jgi:ribosomal protein L19E
MPMREAVRLAQAGQSIRLRVSALDAKGNPITIDHEIAFPPVVTPQEFRELPKDDLVSRRRTEIQAADIQIAARLAARKGRWDRVEEAIAELKALGEENEWIKASVPFLERLMQARDEEAFSKESYHKAYFMRSRVSALDESAHFSASAEESEAEFMRRKMAQGRRST